MLIIIDFYLELRKSVLDIYFLFNNYIEMF